MKQANWPKFPVLSAVYRAVSAHEFFSTVVPVIMRQENYSLESIGLLQLVKLPWILKFLWAPLVDNNASTMRQYKRWIYLSEFFYALIILHIGFLVCKLILVLIVALMLIAFTASATQDIATDAFAILLLKKKRTQSRQQYAIGRQFYWNFTGQRRFAYCLLLFRLVLSIDLSGVVCFAGADSATIC